MILFKGITRFLLNRKVNAASKKKKQRSNHFTFKDVKSVGILFSADSMVQLEAIGKYITNLNNSGKRVSTICIYQDKTLPVLNQSGLLIDFVLPKEVNLRGVPKPSFVKSFIENKFDLLLDLDINEIFPVEYMSAKSHATFKVGKHTKVNEYIFDMMLDIEESKGINYFIEQVDNYLKMINKAA